LNTARALALMFELVPVINSIKDKHLAAEAISADTLQLLQQQMKLYVEDIFGLKAETAAGNEKLAGVLQLLIELRKEAKSRKDFVTSDRIRNRLQELGILLKDEKGGETSYTLA
jgi:cysteinyl-tRNA synthetase